MLETRVVGSTQIATAFVRRHRVCDPSSPSSLDRRSAVIDLTMWATSTLGSLRARDSGASGGLADSQLEMP
ncbi:hypothetical protein J6590_066819 [Homalodisca vitripennis]|nr:hypothetical protein J6590_066819 [Homalodisca vitripennis]